MFKKRCRVLSVNSAMSTRFSELARALCVDVKSAWILLGLAEYGMGRSLKKICEVASCPNITRMTEHSTGNAQGTLQGTPQGTLQKCCEN